MICKISYVFQTEHCVLDVKFGETNSEPYENKLTLRQNVSYDGENSHTSSCIVFVYVSIYTILIIYNSQNIKYLFHK